MSNAPTATYRQHHDVEAPRVDVSHFRQAWRVRTRLDALHVDGQLTRDEWRAACEYRDCCMRLSRGPAGPGSERTSGGADVHERQAALVDVQARVRAAEARLPRGEVKLCRAVVVLDRSWRDLGRWLGCDRETARRCAVAALCALAAAWTAPRLPRTARRRVAAS